MHNVTFCLGSNHQAQANKNIETASRLLQDFLNIELSSSIYPSSSGYLNRVIIGSTMCDYLELLQVTKDLERTLGRLPEHKEQGLVPIDIDIVVWDGEVKRVLDYSSAYFKQGMQEITV